MAADAPSPRPRRNTRPRDALGRPLTYGADGVRDRLAKAYPGVRVIAVPGNHDRTEVVEATFDPAPVRVGGWRVIPVSTNVLGQTEGEAGPPAEAGRRS